MGYWSGELALTQTSTSATGAKTSRADRIMSLFVPVITTVVTTAISTVITVAHTAVGRVPPSPPPAHRPSRTGAPTAAVALTMGPASAKPSAICAVNRAAIATNAMEPGR